MKKIGFLICAAILLLGTRTQYKKYKIATYNSKYTSYYKIQGILSLFVTMLAICIAVFKPSIISILMAITLVACTWASFDVYIKCKLNKDKGTLCREFIETVEPYISVHTDLTRSFLQKNNNSIKSIEKFLNIMYTKSKLTKIEEAYVIFRIGQNIPSEKPDQT